MNSIRVTTPHAEAEEKTPDERRRFQRGGLFSRLEDITYAVLRGQRATAAVEESSSTEASVRSNLAVVSRNERVVYETGYKRTWFVYRSNGSVMAVDVEHDKNRLPIVVGHALWT